MTHARAPAANTASMPFVGEDASRPEPDLADFANAGRPVFFPIDEADNADVARLQSLHTASPLVSSLRYLTIALIFGFIVVVAAVRLSIIINDHNERLASIQSHIDIKANLILNLVAGNPDLSEPSTTSMLADAVFAVGHAVSAPVFADLQVGNQTWTSASLLNPSARELLVAQAAQVHPAGQATLTLTVDTSALHTAWRDQLFDEITLLVAIGLVVLILGYSFIWQSDRTHHATERFTTAHLRLETALNRGKTGLWDWNLETGAIDWSNSMFGMLGYAPAGKALTSDDLAGVLHPTNTDLPERALKLRNSANGQIETTLRLLHADGQWHWIHLHAEVIAMPDGNRHLIGAANDITEHRRNERKTTEANRHLRDSIEAVSDAFALWDSTGKIIAKNQGFELFNALSNAGALLDGDGQPMAECDLELCAKRLLSDQPCETGLVLNQPLVFGLPDDRWFQVTLRSTHDNSFIFLGNDITRLKEKEQALVDSEARMIGAIGDLTRSRRDLSALAERYNEEKRRAQDASKAKSVFLANMSHELRTPLNAIIGFSEMMRSEVLGPISNQTYAGYARDIHTSGEFLLGVISDVLDMAKLDANRVHIHRQPEPMAAIVGDCLRMVQVDADQAGVELSTDLATDQIVHVDRGSIRQILLNLLTNAVKFTPRGGTVHVRARIQGNTHFLSVTDNGIGIPADKIHSVTEPFEQAHRAIGNPGEGSGLGLAISRRLTELHHGKMRIFSKEDVGTCVALALPQAAAIVDEGETSSFKKINAPTAARKVVNFPAIPADGTEDGYVGGLDRPGAETATVSALN